MVVERRSSLTMIGKHTASWHSGQEVASPNDLESAIPIALQPGNYIAVLSSTNNTTEIGLVEVYDIVGKAPGYYSYFTPSSSFIEQLEIDRSQRMTARASPPPPDAACHLSIRQRHSAQGQRVSSLSSEQSGDIAVIVRPER